MRNRSSLVALALVVLCSGILPGCGKPPTDVPSQPELAWQTASTASASSGTTVSASPPFSSTSAATSPVETIRSSAPSKTRTASASPTTAKLPPDPQKVPLGFLGVPVFSMAESRSWYFFVHASTVYHVNKAALDRAVKTEWVSPDNLVAQGDWLYLSADGDCSSRIYRCRFNGSQIQDLGEKAYNAAFAVEGDWIYTIAQGAVVKKRLDGTDQTVVAPLPAKTFPLYTFLVCEGCAYFTARNEDKTICQLFRVDLRTGRIAAIRTWNVSADISCPERLVEDEGWLYYQEPGRHDTNSRQVMRLRLDGTDESGVCYGWPQPHKGRGYCLRPEGGLAVFDLDNPQNVKPLVTASAIPDGIVSGGAANLSWSYAGIFDDWIYYQVTSLKASRPLINGRIRPDGTGNEILCICPA